MQEPVRVTGMVLEVSPVGETDRRVVLLTKERGKISAFARGARKQGSRLMAATNPFCFGEFVIYEGRNSYSLSEAVIANYFEDRGITKVFTIESSGIAPAVMAAIKLDVPMVILKKQQSKILNGEVYQTKVTSFTKGTSYELTLSKKYIDKDDKILLIDDFLANGEAAQGGIRLIEEAGATVSGIGIVIEKSFQPGRKKLDDRGFDVYSLARISRLDKGVIEFVEEA